MVSQYKLTTYFVPCSTPCSTAEFLEIYRRSMDVPNNKHELPQTANQEIGWDTQPLASIIVAAIMAGGKQ